MDINKKIEQAKLLLQENGYYIDNLWCVDDVQQNFYCTDNEAMCVLEELFDNDHVSMVIADELTKIAEDYSLVIKP